MKKAREMISIISRYVSTACRLYHSQLWYQSPVERFPLGGPRNFNLLLSTAEMSFRREWVGNNIGWCFKKEVEMAVSRFVNAITFWHALNSSSDTTNFTRNQARPKMGHLDRKFMLTHRRRRWKSFTEKSLTWKSSSRIYRLKLSEQHKSQSKWCMPASCSRSCSQETQKVNLFLIFMDFPRFFLKFIFSNRFSPARRITRVNWNIFPPGCFEK